MGALFSAQYWNRRVRAGPLSELEAEFDTGDIVLFAGRGFSAYLTKVGTWSGFSNVGFLIREKPGPEGLVVCHSGAKARRGSSSSPRLEHSPVGKVKLSRFQHYLNDGGFDLVLVRKLRVPLSESERRDAADFAKEAKGRVMNRRVSLLMASEDAGELCAPCCCSLGCCTGRHDVERFFCSELVAGMLVRVRRVEASPAGGEYLPRVPSREVVSSDGRVFMSPINVQVPDRLWPRGSGEVPRSLSVNRKSVGADTPRWKPGITGGGAGPSGGHRRAGSGGVVGRAGGKGRAGADGHRRSKSHNPVGIEPVEPS